jgi:predicted kinase
MLTSQPTLYLLCGKIAAGKSTVANRLATRPATVLISEDHWNSNLFPGKLKTIEDYSRYSSRLRNAMGPHVGSLLKAGMSVVLDFPANTLASRSWMRRIFEDANAANELHFLDVSDETCKRRLRERNSAGEHPFQASESDYEIFTSRRHPTRGSTWSHTESDYHRFGRLRRQRQLTACVDFIGKGRH